MNLRAILSAARNAIGVNKRSIGYEGAAGGRRLRGAGNVPSTIAAQLVAYRSLAQRARYLEANNAYARAGVEAHVSALVGSGIKPQSAHPDPDVRKALNAAFERFARTCDFDGLADFYGMQAIVARRVVTDGDIFAVLAIASGELRIRLMDADQVDGSNHSELSGGARIVAGIEFDDMQRRVAVHAWRERPGLPIVNSLEMVRIPAKDICHVFRVETPGQVRGISWFSPVLMRLLELDTSHDAQLMRQKIAALFTGFVVDPNGDAIGMAETGEGGTSETTLEPGTIKQLEGGQDIRFSDPAPIGAEVIDFMKLMSHEISAGLGVPYEMMTGDLSGVNYSSIRAGLVDFRRRTEAVQFNMLVRQFCEPVWRRFVTTEILSGRLDAPGFETDPEPYLASNWLPPKSDWVDPLKDAQAEIVAINAGLMSRRQAVAARGYDLEALDSEIAEDRAATATLGLDFSSVPPAKQNKDEAKA